MPQPMRRKASEQVMVQLIEADVDIGFSLVDEAKAYRADGNTAFSARALHDANEAVADIERRLAQLGDSQAHPFLPLLAELREQIASVTEN